MNSDAKRVLVTGLSGFVGGWLKMAIPQCLSLTDVTEKAVDIVDCEAVTAAVHNLEFDTVIHLAAQAFVPESFRNPTATYKTNFIGTHNLLQALKQKRFGGRVLFVSSADVYGIVKESELPVTEARVLSPLNPYSVSKVAAEELCRYFQRVEMLDIVIARPFNHIGPGQSPSFAISDFAKSIIEIKKGLRPPELSVGDLDVSRDFTDVRDVVAAYESLLSIGQTGETYNICSGVERNMHQAVCELMAISGVNVPIKVDPARLRKADQRRVRGDSEKIRSATGWQCRISWEDSLKNILSDWENKIQ